MWQSLKNWLKHYLPWLQIIWLWLNRGTVFYFLNRSYVLKQLKDADIRKSRSGDVFVFVYDQEKPMRLLKSLKLQNYDAWKLVSKAEFEVFKGDTTSVWVCYAEYDMYVEQGALSYLAAIIAREKGVQSVYSDHLEYKSFARKFPKVKPAWSPEYFERIDYIGSSCWIKYDSYKNNDDSIAKTLLNLPASAIGHVALPLVTVFNDTEIQNHVLKKPLLRQDKSVKTSIIIPTRNGVEYLKPCVESVLETTNPNITEVIIIDNQSDSEETLRFLEDIEENQTVRVIRYNQPFNFSAMNNEAVNQAKGEMVCLLNNDTKAISSNWLAWMQAYALKPDVGCVGAKLFYPDGRIQHAGVVMGYGGGADHAFKYSKRTDAGYMRRLVTGQNYSAVTAACLLVRKSVYLEVGGLDESLTVAFNDVDFCLKVKKAGYRNVWVPEAELIHFESPSRGLDNTPEKAARFAAELAILKARWQAEIDDDPAYSVWLANNRHDFAYSKQRIRLDDIKLR
ncbi:MAG: glycosyltransferase family 2 protein [Thiomicrorhabdus sp.]|nr:glycosyltransferase family 2 protein [Thiomicrorhabdus sp.]